MAAAPAKLFSHAGPVLFTAALYFVTVKFTLYLTLPLGFAHLLWPAAGIAMLCALRWGGAGALGAGLGRVLVEVVALSAADGSTLSAADFWILSITRPCAVALQAYAACWLQQRFTLTTLSIALAPFRSLLRALIIGPGACLIGATAATLALPSSSPPHGADVLYYWLAFWAGDSLAVIGVLPLASLLGWTYRQEPAVVGSSRVMITLMLSLSVLGWLTTAYVHTAWLERAQMRFAIQTDEFQSRLKARLDDGRLMLISLRAFFESSEIVTPEEFERFSGQLLASNEGELSLGWIERQDGAQTRLVLRFAHPQDANRAALGHDFLADMKFSAALRQALTEDRIQTIENANFLGRETGIPASILLLPVYNPTASRPAVAGFVAASLNLDRIAEEARRQIRALLPGTHIHLIPAEDAGKPPLLSVQAAPQGLALLPIPDVEPSLPGFMQYRPLQVGDTRWTLLLSVPQSLSHNYLTEPSWWIGPVVVQLLAALLAATLLLARAEAVRRLEQRLGSLWQRFNGLNSGGNHAAADTAPSLGPAPNTEHLRRAFTNDEFVPHFQPIVNLHNGRVEGVEVLLRWPKAPGNLQISSVIDWAEHNGVIVELGERTLHKALHVLARWRQELGYSGWIAVNISAMQLHDPAWVDTTLTALHQANVPGHRLVLEITESLLVRTRSASPQIAKLREAGVHVSLDDFGIGYSSMSYLHRLPVDQLKLDRSFIAGLGQDPVAQEIVHTVVSLARALKLDVTAEGVEDAATARLLRTLGCSLAQGWLFSKAVDESIITGLIQRGFEPPG